MLKLFSFLKTVFISPMNDLPDFDNFILGYIGLFVFLSTLFFRICELGGLL